MTTSKQSIDYQSLAKSIKLWGKELGFQQIGICDIDLSQDERYLNAWLEQGMHGEMDYMARHGQKRSRPEQLLPGTLTILSLRMDYLPENANFSQSLGKDDQAYIARYALGRDYHKLIRKKLQLLANKITLYTGEFGHRVFVDSAPVMERAIATRAGIGFTGKHSLLIHKEAGSWFFLGEIYTDLPLPIDKPVEEGCGSCTACMSICPTQAIVAPYVVDSRRCISYLTIELRGSIPEEFRSLMGNRIYGCDDCQLTCPWNRFSNLTTMDDFKPRNNFNETELVGLFNWTEEEFLKRTEGSPIRRIGYDCWMRNIAVALGNAKPTKQIQQVLKNKLEHKSELIREHVIWALANQEKTIAGNIDSSAKGFRQNLKLINTIEKMLPRDA